MCMFLVLIDFHFSFINYLSPPPPPSTLSPSLSPSPPTPFPPQVYDLSPDGPEAGLLQNKHRDNLRVIVCGGDGSVCWVHGVMDRLMPGAFPPVGVLPLGTGNDLAR